MFILAGARSCSRHVASVIARYATVQNAFTGCTVFVFDDVHGKVTWKRARVVAI